MTIARTVVGDRAGDHAELIRVSGADFLRPLAPARHGRYRY
jgi:hypothetical protein